MRVNQLAKFNIRMLILELVKSTSPRPEETGFPTVEFNEVYSDDFIKTVFLLLEPKKNEGSVV